jgi:hypothetical protein
MHEGTHAYVDNYGRIWPAASRPEGESQAMNFRGQFLGAVKQLSIDPHHTNTPAGNWARWFVTHPEIPESEMYSVFATEAGNWRDLPPYMQSFYRGLFTNESVEGMRKASQKG